jgi:hypothetical protein
VKMKRDVAMKVLSSFYKTNDLKSQKKGQCAPSDFDDDYDENFEDEENEESPLLESFENDSRSDYYTDFDLETPTFTRSANKMSNSSEIISDPNPVVITTSRTSTPSTITTTSTASTPSISPNVVRRLELIIDLTPVPP